MYRYVHTVLSCRAPLPKQLLVYLYRYSCVQLYYSSNACVPVMSLVPVLSCRAPLPVQLLLLVPVQPCTIVQYFIPEMSLVTLIIIGSVYLKVIYYYLMCTTINNNNISCRTSTIVLITITLKFTHIIILSIVVHRRLDEQYLYSLIISKGRFSNMIRSFFQHPVRTQSQQARANDVQLQISVDFESEIIVTGTTIDYSINIQIKIRIVYCIVSL